MKLNLRLRWRRGGWLELVTQNHYYNGEIPIALSRDCGNTWEYVLEEDSDIVFELEWLVSRGGKYDSSMSMSHRRKFLELVNR